MYLIFSFSRFAVTYRRWKCICFSPFSDLQSLLDAKNVSAFLLFAICSHFGNPGVYLFFSFWRFAVTLGFMSVSAFYFFAICGHFWYLGLYLIFLLLVICSHILTPEMYLLFSFFRFAVTYRRQKAMSKAW